jgi:predicted MFS family arabinose efflux permease
MANARTETSLHAGLKKSTFQLFLATGAWVGSTALMSFGPSALWDFDIAVTFLAIAANLIVGGFMLYSFFRHLKHMDELQRQTHLEAMALTLGITMVLTVIYGALPQVNILTSAQPANVLFVIGISYILSVITLWLRRTSE